MGGLVAAGSIVPCTFYLPGLAGLRRQSDRCIRRPKAGIAPTLDDLEEEALGNGPRINLEIFTAGIRVIQDSVVLHPVDCVRGEVEAASKIVIVVRRDGQGVESRSLHA